MNLYEIIKKNLKESKGLEDFEGTFEGNNVKSSLHSDKYNDTWIIGDIAVNGETYRVNAKVFQEGSIFGIDNGPVSKLWIADSNGEWVTNYDRGWDVKPSEDFKEIYNIILGAVKSYRNSHPLEVEEEIIEEAERPNDKVYIICYGELEIWPNRRSAFDYYQEGAGWCEGSEQERYMNIVQSLYMGDIFVDDEGPEKVTSISDRDEKGKRIAIRNQVRPMTHEEAFDFIKKGILKESDSDMDDEYIDPNYKVDTSGLQLTNYGYHNNSDIIYGRIKLIPKDKDSKLMPGHYDIIYFVESEDLMLYNPGTDVRTAVEYLYNYGSDEYDWVKWNGSRILLDKIYEVLNDEKLKNVPQEQIDSIMNAISDAYFKEEPFPLDKVNYQ